MILTSREKIQRNKLYHSIFFCSLYFSLAFLAVKIILLFFYLVGIRRPTH